MKTLEAKQSEQGQVSAPAEPKDKKQEHLDLGVADVLKTTSCYDPAFRLEVLEAAINQAAKVTQELELKPEQVTQEKPDLDIADLGIQRLKRWLLSRDLNAKIAVCLVRTLQQGDSGMSSLIDEVNWQYEDDLAELLKNPPENLSDEDNYNIGICLASQMWEKYSMGRAEYKAESIN